jgi:pimeloyl-ACP methyl ester carboxylesterase
MCRLGRHSMRTALLLIIAVIQIHAQDILRIPGSRGEIIEGRLTIPSSGYTDKIVIDVPGTGPNTYDNFRKIGRSITFRYNEYFANEFSRRGIAYFSYSTRYTLPDTTPPYFDKVDKEKFQHYTPSDKVSDLEDIIRYLRTDKRLISAKFILLGWSEGAIIASLVAERKRAAVDALFLAGTPSDDVYSTILWQHSGAASMINYRKFFDTNNDGIIQRSEYVNADPRAITRMGGRKFEELDMNGDSLLTIEDFRVMLQPRLQAILGAVERRDDEWIWNSFFRIGTQWIEEHRALEPNKTRILKLDIPVFLFHGRDDANCPVGGVEAMEQKAKELQKTNVHVFTFPGHDHSLEFISWVVRQSMPDGLKTLFDQVDRF